MVEALSRNVRLIDAYVDKAMTDDDYLGEIAAKLRVLIVDIPRNRKHTPLLLGVANAYKSTLGINPINGDNRAAFTWTQFLDSMAMHTSKPGNEPHTLTYRDFIRGWAEQAGGAHEDWEIDSALLEMIQFGARVGDRGFPIAKNNLLAIAKNVSQSAKVLLSNVETLRRIKELTDTATAEKANINNKEDGD